MKSERLEYLPLDKSCAKDLYNLWSNGTVVKYMVCPRQNSVDECIEWIEKLLTNQKEPNVFIAKYDGKLIGIAGVPKWYSDKLEYGLHYQIAEKYWGNGFAYEIAETMIEYAFKECKAETIDTYVVTENIGSIKVLEKIGMNLLETRIDEFIKNGVIYDEYHYIINKEEWNSKCTK